MRVLVDGEVELTVQLGVARVAVGERAHLLAQPAQAGRVDLARGQRSAQRLQRRADPEVLLDLAEIRHDHGAAPVGVAAQQAFGFQPPHCLADRGLADAEPLGQVTLAQLLPRPQLAGHEQLVDERGDHVGLADIARDLGGHGWPPVHLIYRISGVGKPSRFGA